VAKLTALTSLNMSSGKLAAGDALLYLPTQLRELHLGAMQYMDCELPAGLTRLTGLEMLSIALNRSFSQLPAWLSELQGLEILDLSDTEITTEQQVLAQLPALRCVALPGDAPAAEVYGAATHLHWGHSDRWVSWYALRYHK
jgi:Leucine-rich repeat (LRR) protein